MNDPVKSVPITSKILLAGLIAGIIGGIVANIARIIEALFGLPTAIPGMLTVETMLYHLGYAIGYSGIFGAVFVIFYSRFYDAIPGKGVKKGLVFGSIMYLFSNLYLSSLELWYGLLTGVEQWFLLSAELAYVGFFALLPYGIVLGVLYERWK